MNHDTKREVRGVRRVPTQVAIAAKSGAPYRRRQNEIGFDASSSPNRAISGNAPSDQAHQMRLLAFSVKIMEFKAAFSPRAGRRSVRRLSIRCRR
jgi:hypothetical protein